MKEGLILVMSIVKPNSLFYLRLLRQRVLGDPLLKKVYF